MLHLKLGLLVAQVLDRAADFLCLSFGQVTALALLNLVGQVHNILIAFTNQILFLLDLSLTMCTQSLRVDQFASQVFNLTNDSFVLLVDRGFLPAREHNDEVKFADSLLCGSL